MIKSIQFKNFKVLRDCTLPLSQFTLLIGPNGSGKTTALQGILALRQVVDWERCVTVGEPKTRHEAVEITLACQDGSVQRSRLEYGPRAQFVPEDPVPKILKMAFEGGKPGEAREVLDNVGNARVFSLDATAIPAPAELRPEVTLAMNGAGLAGVLDRLRDQEPERWDTVNDELHFWMPEFDRILFDTPIPGLRSIKLRMTEGGHAIPARDLSQGTLLALAILTIAYTPNPPPIVGLEEPDRGLHPRLLRVVRDAMYRLAYPDQFEDKRPGVQVIATTHSPYMLDQFKDHPEEVVIANRVDGNVKFERLSDRPDLDEILKDSVLGDAWYSGILGGVPAQP